MKFKVGQIVELADNSGMVAKLGARAKVTEADYVDWGSSLIDVLWIKDTGAGNQMNGAYLPCVFKLVGEESGQLLFDFMSD